MVRRAKGDVLPKKKLNDVRELPPWASLARYRRLRRLSAAGWFYQFALRASCLEGITSWHGKPSSPDEYSWLETEPTTRPKKDSATSAFLGLVANDPVIRPVHLSPLDLYDRLSLALHSRQEEAFSALGGMGVHFMTVEELYMNELFLFHRARKHAKTFFEEDAHIEDFGLDTSGPSGARLQRYLRFLARKARVVDGPLPLMGDTLLNRSSRNLYEPWLSQPLQSHQAGPFPHDHLALSVDFTLPDSLLVEQFKICLAKHRQARGAKAPPRFGRPAFKRWMSDGVLPYLDLKIWAKAEHVIVPYRILADFLFPRGGGDEERVRKTTSRKASELISTDKAAFKTLRAQAAADPERGKWFMPDAPLLSRKE